MAIELQILNFAFRPLSDEDTKGDEIDLDDEEDADKKSDDDEEDDDADAFGTKEEV